MPQKHKPSDITIRIQRKRGGKATRKQALAAMWAAYKIAKRGGSIERELEHWTLHAINWRSGGKSYSYPSGGVSLEEALVSMGPILDAVDFDNLRVETP